MTRDEYRMFAGKLLDAGRNKGLADHEIYEILSALLLEFKNRTFDLTEWLQNRSPALDEIESERARHKTLADGEIDNVDDEGEEGALAEAASAYLEAMDERANARKWPFSPVSFKPRERRSNLVRAGALIVAEIDRLDRLEQNKAD